VKLYTAQYRYPGIDRLDIKVKGEDLEDGHEIKRKEKWMKNI
jgi:hypothetical protein